MNIHCRPSDVTAPSVVCVGLATWDVIAATRRYPAADERVEAEHIVTAGGGPAATAATVLARHGWPVAFAGVVGDDDAGRRIHRGLQDEGVDVDLLHVVPGAASGTSVVVASTSARTRAIVTHLPPELPDLDEALVARCRDATYVHVDHVGAAAVLRARSEGRLDGALVSFDEGNATDVELDGVDLYVPSAHRLEERVGQRGDAALEAALAAGPAQVVATRGADGCRVATADGLRVDVPALGDVPVRSTLGAGDVFHGGLLSGLLQGLSLVDAARFATATAALSCLALDGRSAVPDRATAAAAVRPLHTEASR